MENNSTFSEEDDTGSEEGSDESDDSEEVGKNISCY